MGCEAPELVFVKPLLRGFSQLVLESNFGNSINWLELGKSEGCSPTGEFLF